MPTIKVDRYKEFLNDPTLFDQTNHEINQRLLKFDESYEDDEFCKLCHDVALYYLNFDTYYGDPKYPEEPDDLAWYIAERCWIRLNADWKYRITDWMKYVRIMKMTYYSQYCEEFEPDEPEFVDEIYRQAPQDVYDTELIDAIRLSSGLRREYRDAEYQPDTIKPDQILDHVLSTKCRYKSGTLEYKRIVISLIKSLTVGVPTLYKLDQKYINHLKYLINSYNVILRKFIKTGVIDCDP